jgi:hypothetical protein
MENKKSFDMIITQFRVLSIWDESIDLLKEIKNDHKNQLLIDFLLHLLLVLKTDEKLKSVLNYENINLFFIEFIFYCCDINFIKIDSRTKKEWISILNKLTCILHDDLFGEYLEKKREAKKFWRNKK